MKTLFRVLIAAIVFSVLNLEAASPDLQNSTPRGGQRGTEVKVALTGNRLDDMDQVMFHQPGISARDIKVINGKKVEATFVISESCALGEHHMRLVGKSGFSYARTFWVGPFAEVKEKEPNDDFVKPQVISINSTVNGAAKPEENDFYQIFARKGQRISVEIEALRINNLRNNVAMDPYAAIFTKKGDLLGESDDSAILKQESVVSVLAPEDGDYVIEIRDAAYQGRGFYRAHIGSTPRPLSVYPAGGRAGTEVEFTFLGDPKGSYRETLTLPSVTEFHEVYGSDGEQIPVSGNKVRVSSFDNVLEQEPNNLPKEVALEPKSLPLAFNGVLGKEGDSDYFKFTAKKGQRFRFRSYANRLGTPVDTVLQIFDAKMKQIGRNDDADRSKDSRIDFKVPTNGEYYLRVMDMLKRGGDTYVYRVETEPYEPRVRVSMPEMLRRDNQYRKQFNIPQGDAFAMTVNVKRENWSGELVFDLPELPEGVTWESGPIPKQISQFPILLKAAPDAPIGGQLCDLWVKSTDDKKPISAKYRQEIHFVRGNPNGTSYYSSVSDELPIAVTEKAPFRITIDQPKVPIVRDGTLRLKVRAHRNPGYQKKITTRMLWRPPGISCPSTVTFGEKATEVEYEINAKNTAQIAEWKICLVAESNPGKGVIFTASPFIKLKVEEPFAKLKMSMTTLKQGGSGEIHCEVENLREFPGQGEVQLFGLPAKTTTQILSVDQETKELRFPIKAARDSPVGQHKNLFCTLVLSMNGERIEQRLGMGGMIRVDPAPVKVAKVGPKKTGGKSSKPMSRLEQLRMEAKKQRN